MSANLLVKPDLVIDALPINQKYFAVIRYHKNTAYRFSSGNIYTLQKGIFQFDALCIESRLTQFCMLSNIELELAGRPSLNATANVSFICFKGLDSQLLQNLQ